MSARYFVRLKEFVALRRSYSLNETELREVNSVTPSPIYLEHQAIVERLADAVETEKLSSSFEIYVCWDFYRSRLIMIECLPHLRAIAENLTLRVMQGLSYGVLLSSETGEFSKTEKIELISNGKIYVCTEAEDPDSSPPCSTPPGA